MWLIKCVFSRSIVFLNIGARCTALCVLFLAKIPSFGSTCGSVKAWSNQSMTFLTPNERSLGPTGWMGWASNQNSPLTLAHALEINVMTVIFRVSKWSSPFVSQKKCPFVMSCHSFSHLCAWSKVLAKGSSALPKQSVCSERSEVLPFEP